MAARNQASSNLLVALMTGALVMIPGCFNGNPYKHVRWSSPEASYPLERTIGSDGHAQVVETPLEFLSLNTNGEVYWLVIQRLEEDPFKEVEEPSFLARARRADLYPYKPFRYNWRYEIDGALGALRKGHLGYIDSNFQDEYARSAQQTANGQIGNMEYPISLELSITENIYTAFDDRIRIGTGLRGYLESAYLLSPDGELLVHMPLLHPESIREAIERARSNGSTIHLRISGDASEAFGSDYIVNLDSSGNLVR